MRETRRIDDTHLWELKQLWTERRRALGIPEPLTDLVAIDLQVQRQRLQQEGAPIPREVGNRIIFTSANHRLNFEFLYPVAWQVREFSQENHSAVFILGPRNRDNTYSLALAVHVFPAREQGGKYGAVADVVGDYRRRSRHLTGFREIAVSRGVLAGTDAVEVVISYTMSLSPDDVNSHDTTIVERKIIAKRKDQFYELIYRAVWEDYYTFLPVFRDAVRTFEFRDRRPEAWEFYPLLIPVPAYAVREQEAEYNAQESE